jgi:hypothetical protein
VTITAGLENSSSRCYSSPTSGDIQLETLLCLSDGSNWEFTHDAINQSLCENINADRKPISLFDFCLSLFSSLSCAVAKSLRYDCLREGHTHQHLVGDLVRVCWCCIRFQFPRLSDLQFLFQRMSLSESILIAEISLETLRSSAKDPFLPSHLGSVSDFVMASLTNWEARGIFEEDNLIQLPCSLSADAGQSLDSVLEHIRCHWVAILYLHRARSRCLGAGNSHPPSLPSLPPCSPLISSLDSSQQNLLKLSQQLVFLLNGHTITLTHLADSTAETHSVNEEVLEKLISTEVIGMEKYLEALLSSTSFLGTIGWRPRIQSVFSMIRMLSDSGTDPDHTLSISNLGLFTMPRVIPPEILLAWFRDISVRTSNLNFDSAEFSFCLFSDFVVLRIRQDLPQSLYSMPLLLLYASASIGQFDIWILLANQMLSHASGPLRDLINARNGGSDEVDDSCQLFQYSLICSITIRTFFLMWTGASSQDERLSLQQLFLRGDGELLQASLIQWFVFLSAVRESFLSLSHCGKSSSPLSQFVSEVYRELQYLFSFLIRNSLLQSPHLRSQLLYSTIACSPVDISESLSPFSTPSSQGPPQSILQRNSFPSFQILCDLMIGQTHPSVVPTLISLFAVSILKILESLCFGMRILSEDSAIFLEQEQLSPRLEFVGERNKSSAVPLDWVSFANSCSANLLAALLFSVERLVILASLCELDGVRFEESQEEEEEVLDDQWECLLRILVKISSDFSCRGMFLLDTGKVSTSLHSKFSQILWHHYLPQMEQTPQEDDRIGTNIFLAPLENFSDETLASVMTILGQVSHDLYAFPLCQNYCANKSISLQMIPSIEKFSDLYLLIKFCAEFMGLSNSLRRASSSFLFTTLPQLRHPSRFHSECLTREMKILQYLADPTSDWTILHLSPFDVSSSQQNLLKVPMELLISFYLDLLKFGLPETEFDLSVFPQRLPTEQSQSDQIFFEVREEDMRSYAHINLCLTALTIQPSDIEVWMKIHERLLELLYRDLDEVSRHIYPFQNLPSELLECSFQEILSIQHVFLGTFSLSPHALFQDVVTQLSPWVHSEEIQCRSFPPEYSSDSPHPPSLYCDHPPPCEVRSFFIPSHDGESAVDPPVDLKDSDYFLPLTFAKLNTTVKLCMKIANVIQLLYRQLQNHNLSEREKQSDLEDIASKYLSLCEARSVMCLTLSKMFSSSCNSMAGTYQRCLRGSLYNAIVGLEILEDNSSTSSSLALSMTEIQFTKANPIDLDLLITPTIDSVASMPHHPSRYFLLFMKGKLLWKLTKRGEMALPFLYEANRALSKLITGGERIDKRLKAVVVCEIQKIRFYSSMRVLWQLHNHATLTAPVSVSLPTTVNSQESHSAPLDLDRLLVLLSREGVGLETGVLSSALPVPSSSAADISESHSTVICNSCGHPKELSNLEQHQLAYDLLMQGNPHSTHISLVAHASLDTEPIINAYRAVAADSLKEMASCRSWDSADFQSIFLLSRFLHGFALSKLYPDLAWVASSHLPPLHSSVLLPSFAEAIGASLTEMHKLFEKKKVQIVSMWSHENTPHRLHQVNRSPPPPPSPSSSASSLWTDLREVSRV